MSGMGFDAVRRGWIAGRMHLDVPEWPNEDGTPLRIYYTQVTPGEVELLDKTNDELNRSNVGRVVHFLIFKAKDKDGYPLFQLGDAIFFESECSWTVLNRVVSDMSQAMSIKSRVPEAEKKSEETPPSTSASS